MPTKLQKKGLDVALTYLPFSLSYHEMKEMFVYLFESIADGHDFFSPRILHFHDDLKNVLIRNRLDYPPTDDLLLTIINSALLSLRFQLSEVRGHALSFPSGHAVKSYELRAICS